MILPQTTRQAESIVKDDGVSVEIYTRLSDEAIASIDESDHGAVEMTYERNAAGKLVGVRCRIL